jgi:hypothetical protein
MTFEEELQWVMQNIDSIEVQDFVDFFTSNRRAFMDLQPDRKPGSSVSFGKTLEELEASPFGQKMKIWVSQQPVETGDPDPEMVEAFDELLNNPPASPVMPEPEKPSEAVNEILSRITLPDQGALARARMTSQEQAPSVPQSPFVHAPKILPNLDCDANRPMD